MYKIRYYRKGGVSPIMSIIRILTIMSGNLPILLGGSLVIFMGKILAVE
jgi:hypothetical protein